MIVRFVGGRAFPFHRAGAESFAPASAATLAVFVASSPAPLAAIVPPRTRLKTLPAARFLALAGARLALRTRAVAAGTTATLTALRARRSGRRRAFRVGLVSRFDGGGRGGWFRFALPRDRVAELRENFSEHDGTCKPSKLAESTGFATSEIALHNAMTPARSLPAYPTVKQSVALQHDRKFTICRQRSHAVLFALPAGSCSASVRDYRNHGHRSARYPPFAFSAHKNSAGQGRKRA